MGFDIVAAVMATAVRVEETGQANHSQLEKHCEPGSVVDFAEGIASNEVSKETNHSAKANC